jgi:hypothetical protein
MSQQTFEWRESSPQRWPGFRNKNDQLSSPFKDKDCSVQSLPGLTAEIDFLQGNRYLDARLSAFSIYPCDDIIFDFIEFETCATQKIKSNSIE